jgi:flagellar biosynthesis/type III secretory pathway protein FliH
MDTKNQNESQASEPLDGAAQELAAESTVRDEGRVEIARNEQEDLNQGMQTGTHDALHTGIKWGSSYKVKATTANPKE